MINSKVNIDCGQIQLLKICRDKGNSSLDRKIEFKFDVQKYHLKDQFVVNFQEIICKRVFSIISSHNLDKSSCKIQIRFHPHGPFGHGLLNHPVYICVGAFPERAYCSQFATGRLNKNYPLCILFKILILLYRNSIYISQRFI